MRLEELKAKVIAVNRANKYAMEIYPILVERMTPFIDQKIYKANNEGLMRKVEKCVPEFERTPQLFVYRHVSDYSLAWVAKTCECYLTGQCTYYETVVYVGEGYEGVLKLICKPPQHRFDYTFEEIVEKNRIYQECKLAADNAKSDLFPFTEL